jgi:hypothetical protein
MQIVPLLTKPSQIVSVALNNQACTIRVFTASIGGASTAMFVDLYVNNTLVIGGVIALNKTVIVRSAYLGFVGDLAFIDTQGSNDPTYDGLGTRYFLSYFLPAELPAGVA